LGALAVGLLVLLLVWHRPDLASSAARMKTPQYVGVYVWWAMLGCLGITAGLIVLCPWWASDEMSAALRVLRRGTRPRWFPPLVGLAMLVCAGTGIPRLNQSLWDDEELCVRYSIWGRFDPLDSPAGERSFKPIGWRETVYGYPKGPNNHNLQSIASRAGLETWRVFSGRTFPFPEWPMRVPTLLAGMCSVAGVALLVDECGFPLAGVLAAFLLALHPWHLRYGTEVRGYVFAMALFSFLSLFWLRAMRFGAWKWWALFGAAQVALIYAYPSTLITVAMLNVLTIPLFLSMRESAQPFVIQGGRWFFVNSVSAMALLVLMLPLLPQTQVYLDLQRHVALGWPFVRNALSFFLAGVPWTKESFPDPLYPNLWLHAVNHPYLFYPACVAAALLLLAGIFAFAKKGAKTSVLALVTIASPIVVFLASRMKGVIIYESYVNFVLPGVVALVAVGIVALAELVGKRLQSRLLAPVVTGLAVVVFIAGTWRSTAWLMTHPLQPIKESVILTRGSLDPKNTKKVLTASFCIPPYLYDAGMIRLDSVAEMIALMKRADAEKMPLFLNIGMPWAARDYSPQMWKLFTDRRLFDAPEQLRGFEPGLDRLVARYRPGSAEVVDFSAIQNDAR
jgi:hypothetical protein